MDTPNAAPSVQLPNAPALVVGPRGALSLTMDGEVAELSLAAGARLAVETPPLLCHGRAAARWLNAGRLVTYDLLELFAFVRPAQFCVPTPRGLADALGLERPGNFEEEAEMLFTASARLLTELGDALPPAGAIARAMADAGWPWGAAVLAAIPILDGGREAPTPRTALRIWTRLGEWSEHAPEPPPGHIAVEADETRDRLVQMLGANSEDRPQQASYADAARGAFAPAVEAGAPHVVVAEAGTGVGKTVGYLAPASIWAEKNGGTVWISTFTRNLQRQLDGELDRLYTDPVDKILKTVIRKGRENYLCLLNYEEGLARAGARKEDAIALGMVARWMLATRDGDMVGGDFPSWLIDLLGAANTLGLTDTRGECIYSACTHYGKCYIERSVRRARRADIVIANHALVMTQAAMGGGDEAYMPSRYVFDEGHHLLDAADSAFAAFLSGAEMSELRRWLLGAEGRRRSRARGLEARVGDLVSDVPEGVEALGEILKAAHVLPHPGWMERLAGGSPVGPAEAFLQAVRQQIYARDDNRDLGYDLEADVQPLIEGMAPSARALGSELADLVRPVRALVQCLAKILDTEADELETATRQRIESVSRSLERRARLPIESWRSMLASLEDETPPEMVDWLALERRGGRDFDVGMHRNWIDPTIPFTEAVIRPSHGAVITSATLRDGTGDSEADWRGADWRTGAEHLSVPPERVNIASPFDYPNQARILVVSDVNKNDTRQLAAAFRVLMQASGGGAIGLFTSIARLRAVHGNLLDSGFTDDMMLLAQHVDPMDTGTLVDIFRAEDDACLLGTDAVRDGVDVPGRSLRMLIYDRVPWPRPTILHKARKAAFGAGYDDMLTRLKLKQAFGRLIRGAGDRGVFVILDRALPSRLLGAFPEGIEVQRIGLADAAAQATKFLTQSDP